MKARAGVSQIKPFIFTFMRLSLTIIPLSKISFNSFTKNPKNVSMHFGLPAKAYVYKFILAYKSFI